MGQEGHRTERVTCTINKECWKESEKEMRYRKMERVRQTYGGKEGEWDMCNVALLPLCCKELSTVDKEGMDEKSECQGR